MSETTPPLAVVTGATAGLGLATARGLAEQGYRVVIAGRRPDKGRIACDTLRRHRPDADVRFEPLDLDSLASVRAFTRRLTANEPRLACLINNAGLMALPTRERTEDGFERQLGVNYLGHFLLTSRLLPLLFEESRQGKPARVVQLSSLAHRSGRIDFEDLAGARRYDPWRAYRQSKLAMLLFAQALQKRSDGGGWGLLSAAAHPGLSRTALFDVGVRSRPLAGRLFKLVMPLLSQSADDGARPTLYAALANDVRGGDYYGPDGWGETRGQPTRAYRSPAARDPAVEDRLWQVSCELTGATWATSPEL
ncbi:oxidoreductase [Salinicola avicenniae]|uniref:oxidoreductase n=1 Tax=Salinicola avicenniae TaxID=2916836 RepID=UPI0020733DC6|nr:MULTISPECIES: oxidoreductase [unclassified Salinicola]